MELIKFLPLVLALIGGILAAIGWGIYKRNKEMLDEYHRRRGDIPKNE